MCLSILLIFFIYTDINKNIASNFADMQVLSSFSIFTPVFGRIDNF